MILAFAIRTASERVAGLFGWGVFVGFPPIGIMGSNCMAANELCAPGCMLMGPVDVGLRLGIMDNSHVQSWFTALSKARPARTG